MPNWEDALFRLLLDSELAKYPDARLYKAAALLAPEDRPAVPVRVYDDPATGHPYGSKGTRAYLAPDRQTIQVYGKHSDVKNPYKLAAMLAHEQFHVQNGMDEGPAYAKELEVIKKFGPRVSPDFVSALEAMAKAMARLEQKK